ncbi:MAG: hypothetical protein ABH841_03090 [Candidatus Nealsonbacteria bacterium]
MNYASAICPSIISPFILKWKLGFKTAWVLGFALMIALVGFYIFQINIVTQSSFTAVKYEKQIADLDKEFKNLQINFFDVSSLSGLEASLVAKGYEKVGKIHYIQVLEDTVAVK